MTKVNMTICFEDAKDDVKIVIHFPNVSAYERQRLEKTIANMCESAFPNWQFVLYNTACIKSGCIIRGESQ